MPTRQWFFQRCGGVDTTVFNQEPAYQAEIAETFERIVHFSTADEHLQTLYSLRKARFKRHLKEKDNIALITFDTHSDLSNKQHHRQVPLQRLTSGSWVNAAMLENPEITEVIWVRPPEIEKVTRGYGIKEDNPLFDYGENRKAYVHLEKQRLHFGKPPADLLRHPERYREITIRFITLDKLPEMGGRHVILTLDMDYFSNTGHDTIGKTQVPFKGFSQVTRLFKKLNEKQVKPFILTTAVSPRYSFKEPYVIPKWLQRPNPVKEAIMKINTDIEAVANNILSSRRKRPASV